MADADEPHAPGPTSDSTSGGLHPLTAGLLARHDSQRAPTATALSKRPADWPAAEQERAAVRIRGAAPRMANLEPVEKTAVVSDSTGADAAPAIRARPTRSSSAQLALEPTALLNRLETMLLGNQPVPAPSNEVSIVGEVTNGIIIAAKAAVNTLFSSQRRGALMALQIKNLKKAALAYLVWDLRGELAGAFERFGPVVRGHHGFDLHKLLSLQRFNLIAGLQDLEIADRRLAVGDQPVETFGIRTGG